MQSFPTLEDADVKGKRVLVRVDFNVPMHDGAVADVSRIERNAPTITEIADKGGRVVLLSHYGRPKGRDPKESLKPVAAAVAAIIGRPIGFADDCVGEVAERAVAALKPGDILCLENTRFHPGEETNDIDFAKRLARLGDIFVDDAFSVAHRAHASVEAIAHLLPSYAGRAMQEELEALTRALQTPERPLAAIVGGESCRSVASRFGVAVSSVVKWSQRYRATGSVAPGKVGGHRKRVLEPHRAFVLERIGQTPHLTLHGLKEELAARGVNVSHNAVWLFLRREGLRFKKNAVRP